MGHLAVTIASLAHGVTLAWGWRRIALAFAAGAVSTFALAPLNFWPAPFLSFPVLVWLIDGSAAGKLGGAVAAAGIGWWFGFGYFVVGLYWIGNALLVDAKTFGWLLPFAVVALPAGLALFTAFGVGLARLLWSRGARRIFALAVGLTIAEWLRGHLFTGFPWNVFGYALTSPLPLAQGAALMGIWGLTFLAVAVYASPAALADEKKDTRRTWLVPTLSLVLLAGLAGFGAWRLHENPTRYVDAVRLRIMQPNLQQDEKFNYSQKDSVMSRYLALSDRATGPNANGIRDVTHLIWPESAFPFFLTRDAGALAQIASLLPPGAVLITGAVRAPEGVPEAAVTRAYNSVYVIDHDGSILSVYDKVHLVPFGEYLPFQDFLERLGLRQITNLRGGFIPGDRGRILKVPRAPDVLPLVCYEIIFPEAIPRGPRPGWMVNLTNDGWFGTSPGPYQHFQQARIRAIEQGLPLVRAANTGISAVVDPYGRVVARLPLGTEGVLDARLPQVATPTLYSRTGDLPTALAVAAAAILALRGRRRAAAIGKSA
ncbi:MAG TPA: apolipoprotein N-acyltransferase [Xanthobacteraceae bacterium]|nr:apolipoprotein N-acyltransferase [Xanthobacteraceae bacterium]